MSVYKPGKGRFWHFDFVQKGRRYTGSTGATTRSKAERVEAAKRVAAASGELDRPAEREVPTLAQAAATWWASKSDKKSSDQLLSRVSLAVELVGRHKAVNAVTFSDIQEAIRKRRGRLVRGKTVPANATINRDIIATLRPTIELAREALNDGSGPLVPFPVINWGKLSLDEPKPKPKGLTGAEMIVLVDTVPEFLRDFARFQARYGCRLAEMFFAPAAVDVAGRRVTLRDRKGGDDHTIPVSPDDMAMLAARIGRAQKAKLHTVWFREIKGELRPLTYRVVGNMLQDAMTTSGLRASKGARGSHNLRHTAAMDIMRSTGNIRMAQKLLGHANLASTQVYAHVLEDDLRAALDRLSRPAPEPTVEPVDETCENPLQRKES